MKNSKYFRKFVYGLTITVILLAGMPILTDAATPALHDTAYNSGSIYLGAMSDGTNSDVLQKYDAASSPDAYTKATQNILASDRAIIGTVFLPNGDLVALTIHATETNKLFCFTYVSGFTNNCSWSGAGGYAYPANTFLSAISVDAKGQIWAANFGASGGSLNYSGRQIYEVVTGPTATTNTYDASFSGTVNFAPYDIAVDHMGDIWFGSYYNGSTLNSKIYCMDASNSYGPCTGPAFDVNGGIDIGFMAPGKITFNSNNDIFVVTNGVGHLVKINRSAGFTVSSVNLSYGNVNWIAIDNTDKVWVDQYTGSAGSYTGKLNCYTASLTSCGIAEKSFEAFNSPGTVFTDKNNFVWIPVLKSTATSRMYCFNGADGTPCSTTGNFTGNVDSFGSYYLITGQLLYAAFQFNFGDPTGVLISRVFAAVAGDANVNVSAVVDPAITLSFSTPTCSMGILSSASVASCGIQIFTDTNATGGLIVSFKDNNSVTPGLRSANGDIIPAVTDGIVDAGAGAAEYGVSFNYPLYPANSDIQYDPSCIITGGDGNAATGITTSNQRVVEESGPGGTTGNPDAFLCFSAKITDLTPAGSYSQQVLFTAVGRF